MSNAVKRACGLLYKSFDNWLALEKACGNAEFYVTTFSPDELNGVAEDEILQIYDEWEDIDLTLDIAWRAGRCYVVDVHVL